MIQVPVNKHEHLLYAQYSTEYKFMLIEKNIVSMAWIRSIYIKDSQSRLLISPGSSFILFFLTYLSPKITTQMVDVNCYKNIIYFRCTRQTEGYKITDLYQTDLSRDLLLVETSFHLEIRCESQIQCIQNWTHYLVPTHIPTPFASFAH